MVCTVLVVDDHEVVRRGVIDVVESTAGLTVVAEAATARDARVRAAATRPDMALVDLRLPDDDGVSLIRHLRRAHPDIRCVVLTSFDDDEAVARALEAGAVAFVLKTVRTSELATVLQDVAAGKVLLDDSVVDRRRHHDDPIYLLTPTERKVLDLLGDGLTNRQIGDHLNLAEKTVKNHVTGLLSKLKLQRRTQAAAWVVARRSGQWRAGS